MKRVEILLLSMLLAAAACFDPTYRDGIRCSELGRCPDGMTCETLSNSCYWTLPDAAPDAPACSGPDDPCGEHGACQEVSGGYECECEPGYGFDGLTCVDTDECDLPADPCGPNSTCVDGTDEYTCVCDAGYQDTGTACELILHGLVGAGTDAEPRHWDDGTHAESCHAYRAPELPYVYEGSTGDGMYSIQPTAGSEPRQVYCDMATDGGGWTRMVFWDREGDPAVHTLASLQAELVDEITELSDPDISRMTDLREQATYIQWADVNATYDALAYRRDIDVPNRGDLLLDVHYYGYSMERSAIWLYVTANGAAQDLLCRSDAEVETRYSAAERALIPYACPLGIGGSESFTWDGVQQRALGSTTTSFHLRSLHGDSNADRSHLYRLIVWIR